MADTPSMSQLVIEYLAERPGQALKPWQIAKGISERLDGRHVGVGAVSNVCLHEAARGRLVQIDPAPMTFAHPAQSDSGEAGQQ
jgi:hypothetical protein